MLKEAVYHVARDNYAYPTGADTLRVILRAGRGDLKKATVLYQDRYLGSELFLAEMELKARDELFDFYQAELKLSTKRFAYVFLLDDRIKRAFYTEKGFFEDLRPNTHFQYPYISNQDLWEPPLWAQGAVAYQIFPERFAKGDSSIDPPRVEPWETAPSAESYKGGDLEGIIGNFDYLLDLGIDLLYLTPIFTAPSNHKYDTRDYYRIDPYFGSEETVRNLVELCHRHGIKIIFDAVFNHCGAGFFAFQDVLAKGEESPYCSWFNIEGYPLRTDPPNYETFGNQVAVMPKLRTDHPEVQEYFYQVGTYWIREFGIDGWRLDVANEVDREFWRGFRRAVKAENPRALLVGEIWHEAGEWLRGDQFDSVTNYPLQYACLEFFAKDSIRAESFAHRVAKVQLNYTEAVNLALFNLLGSHDTERFLTACGGSIAKFSLAVAFQMTYAGAPLIYYGDEVGLKGGNDPDCRRGMIWDRNKQNEGLLSWYRRLISLRNSYPLLRIGSCRTVWADNASNIFGFVRFGSPGQILVLLNNSPRRAQVDLCAISWPQEASAELRELLSLETVYLKQPLFIEPYGVKILSEKKE
ncbi:MAG: alpha-glycosidase [Firmicutes bacterium]|nr:alpha-glycosidase [Bacillota bacterium]